MLPLLSFHFHVHAAAAEKGQKVGFRPQGKGAAVDDPRRRAETDDEEMLARRHFVDLRVADELFARLAVCVVHVLRYAPLIADIQGARAVREKFAARVNAVVQPEIHSAARGKDDAAP